MTKIPTFLLLIVGFCLVNVNCFGIPKESLGNYYATDRRIIPSTTQLCFSQKSGQNQQQQNTTTAFDDIVERAEDISNTASASISSTTIPLIPICEYTTIEIPTSYDGLPNQKVIIEDLTPTVQRMITECGIINGFVTIISRHTTTAITINEYENRLANDIEEYFLTKLVPPDERSNSKYAVPGLQYKHNDIDQRPDSYYERQRCIENGWDITNPIELDKWRKQEPINAHSHLLSILVGNSECIPIQNKFMVIGQWQSILLIDFDGPRNRTVGIQLMGYR
jgi:thiamine phosphate synthase YjbQ (UPF0047 family)